MYTFLHLFTVVAALDKKVHMLMKNVGEASASLTQKPDIKSVSPPAADDDDDDVDLFGSDDDEDVSTQIWVGVKISGVAFFLGRTRRGLVTY